MAGLKEVHYASQDPWAGSTNLLQATGYLRWKAIRAFGPAEGLLEVLSLALHDDFLARQGPPRLDQIAAVWRREMPHTVEQAATLHRTDLFEQLCRQGATIEQVLARLAEPNGTEPP